jgi:flagellin
MGLRIATNVSSIIAQRHLSTSTNSLAKHSERLSSGFRINHAADDAAGMAIAEKMGAAARSLRQSRRNALDGISLVQTAEGGLNEITNIVSRLRELAVQSASDTIGVKERTYLQKEFSALKDEVDRIANAVEYNGTRLLVGEQELPDVVAKQHNRSPLEIQVGANWQMETDGPAARNPVNTIRLDISKINAQTTGEGSLGIGNLGDENETNISSKEGAQLSIDRLDQALDQVNSYRATLGALQNRLGSSISNLNVQIENADATKSRIKDADYADETAALTQSNILQQAGIAVLSQANNMPQLALRLLQQ